MKRFHGVRAGNAQDCSLTSNIGKASIFGWDFSGLSEHDILDLKRAFNWDARIRAAERIGVSEAELITLDQKILRECGPFPRYTDEFPFGRKRIR